VARVVPIHLHPQADQPQREGGGQVVPVAPGGARCLPAPCRASPSGRNGRAALPAPRGGAAGKRSLGGKARVPRAAPANSSTPGPPSPPAFPRRDFPLV
jgi:hypothetical protein